MAIVHPFPPLYDSWSRILILGSFPSVKSRETGFFYGHKQNRFWKVMANILSYGLKENGEITVPVTAEEKTRMLLDNGIAVWDTIGSCDINGSSDASITNVVPNDLGIVMNNANISIIGCNGKTSYDLFMKYTSPKVQKYGVKVVRLPSTSPANAAYSLDKLIEEWKKLLGI